MVSCVMAMTKKTAMFVSQRTCYIGLQVKELMREIMGEGVLIGSWKNKVCENIGKGNF